MPAQADNCTVTDPEFIPGTRLCPLLIIGWIVVLFFSLISLTPCHAETYLLSPEDQIDISVLGLEDFKSSVTLLPDGTFAYPILG